MSSQRDFGPATGVQDKGAPRPDQLNVAHLEPARPWGRTERKHLLIWLAIGFIAPLPLTIALQHALGPSAGALITVKSELPIKAILSFFAVLATSVVARLEKRPLDDYGTPLRQAFGPQFWEGCVWGFAMLSAVVLIFRETGHFQVDSVAPAGPSLFKYGLGWAGVFLGVAITEEFAFRGYWLFSMARRMRFWPAATFLSIIFAAAHIANHGENALGLSHVFAIGMLFCFTVRRTGTLWFALGMHAAWDWAETFFYGTADSGLVGQGHFLNTTAHGPAWLTGGSVGPEGSVIALAVLALFVLLIHLRFPHAVYPD